MTVTIFTHPLCGEHDPGTGHPESPARLKAVVDGLKRWVEAGGPGAAEIAWAEAAAARADDLTLVHDARLVERVFDAVPQGGYAYLDPDTGMNPKSGEAALRAVGALMAAVDAVIGGTAARAFCAVRPPGHHAEPGRAMGFCLFNNVAIGALHARRAHGLTRVAVVDFDVHHGNGTEAAFRADPDLFFASSHQFPFYPGTGSGADDNAHILNAPLAAGAASAEFRAAWKDRLLPALDRFGPELILVSAGFDAHAADPLAQLYLTEADYTWITQEIRGLAETHCGGRIVSTLEGGYDLRALAASAVAHVAALAAP
ncbi:MAG: histone deacetylase family protein [Alphaproteobacteria bacterium]|nr:histone deacetylase family protein [Alphaproteobacteria bacterium]